MSSTDTPMDTSVPMNNSAVLESELESLYQVSQVLSRSLDFRETLTEVLSQLSDTAKLRHGMICLLDDSSGELLVTALHEKSCTFQYCSLQAR